MTPHNPSPLDHDAPDVLRRVNRNDGFRVPDGYFDSLAERMQPRLDAEEERQRKQQALEAATPRSFWQKVRPYAYLAAMFAGVWCMMQMFTIGAPAAPGDVNIDSRPVLAHALADPSFADEYIYTDSYAEAEDDLMDSLWEAGVDPSTL